MSFVRAIAVLGLASFALGANAQSFNIDIDVSAGGPTAGQGVPGMSFAAAAGQSGQWNRIGAASHTSVWALMGLDGTPTAARLTNTISGSGGGSGWIGNTADHRLLMNDYKRITIPCTYTFTNLLPGHYRVFTYGCDPGDSIIPLEVKVPGAVIETKRSGQALMPGNRFVEGVTHTIHEVTLTGSTLQLLLSDPISNDPPDPSVNGFQLVYTPVPEPTAWVALGLGLVGFLRFRRT